MAPPCATSLREVFAGKGKNQKTAKEMGLCGTDVLALMKAQTTVLAAVLGERHRKGLLAAINFFETKHSQNAILSEKSFRVHVRVGHAIDDDLAPQTLLGARSRSSRAAERLHCRRRRACAANTFISLQRPAVGEVRFMGSLNSVGSRRAAPYTPHEKLLSP